MRSRVRPNFWPTSSSVYGRPLCNPKRKRKMRVIATGGLSPLFARGTDIIEAADGDLTMRGLVLIHRYNKTGKYDE